MNFKLITSVAVGAAIVSVSQAATLNFLGMVSNQNKQVTINYNGKSINVLAGTMNIKVDGGPILNAYCVDLDHFISSGQSWNVNVLSGLAGHPGSTLNKEKVYNIFSNNESLVNSKEKGAALQLAIWDALYDGGDGLSSGSFKATADATTKSFYNNFIAQQSSAPVLPYNIKYYEATSHGAHNDKYQNLMSGEAVPEPATLILVGGTIVAAMRKRRKA